MKKKWMSIVIVAGLALSCMTVVADGDHSDDVVVRVGSLKGPTSMGLVSMMEENEKDDDKDYEFTMVTAADELLPQIISGQIDIALIPANVASVLYNKMGGELSVIDINTLGVLYAVSGDDTLTGIGGLKGRTIYLTGKGTTPDYVLRYLLEQNGIGLDEVTLEYKSEATEVAAVLAETPDAVGILPQPFVTVATTKNEALKPVIDLTQEWDELNVETGSRLVTGVTVVRNEFLEKYEDEVQDFVEDHMESTAFINSHVEEGAELVEKVGIIEKAAIAQKAIPYCNIVCITGEEMKEALSGYLGVLYDMAPESVGGELPDDTFYWTYVED
ncbi:MAG: ABC transporter substrate-binding protein [Lachnospiraceae bacterium]|nr:ABC transporter substrate-binding protein [Robinsoniella sp.]MDY3765939.1 ABC transporter substrate-binding protein [Lachnospiraceae bacterium]